MARPRAVRVRSSFGTSRTRWALAFAVAAVVVIISCGVALDEAVDRDRLVASWGEPGGRWHTGGWRECSPEEERALTEEQRAEFERLRSIGYLAGSTPMPSNSGVIVYDALRASDGLNFYTSGHFPGAVLMDMEGRVIHTWRHGFVEAWKACGALELPRSNKTAGYWRRARLFENGDVLAIFEGIALIKVDRDSRLLWGHFGGAHHDLDVAADGTIYVLTREARIVPRRDPKRPLLEDFITVLDPDGNELSRISLLEAFERSPYAAMLDDMARSGDAFHTNTVELLDGSVADALPPFEAGNLLVSMREPGVIAVVDPEAREVVWALVGSWKKQHQPTVLDNGNVLIFDNQGDAGASRVIEFDPVALEPVWLYRGDKRGDFFSRECGSNQRLPNGNTLITESDRGKAFEVTPDGEVVWKYLNPEKSGPDSRSIATIFEMIRIGPAFPTDWLGSDFACRAARRRATFERS